jgi:hypothetical protein
LIENRISEDLKDISEDELLKKIQKDVDKEINSLVPDSWTNDQQHKFIT